MRTYTLTRIRKTARNETWCSACLKGHRRGSKPARVHAAHLVPPVLSVGVGSFDLTFRPDRDIYRGVPEVLAIRAAETGEFEARLEEKN